jgi:DNA-binding beta-propeller fold protein YncE
VSRSIRQIRTLLVGFSLLMTAGLLLAAPASAGFEQIATFSSAGENSPLTAVQGIAVNIDGAGGAAPGTIYAVTDSTHNGRQLLRYSKNGELLGATPLLAENAPKDVAVDQATGNAYVLGFKNISVYSPDGSKLIGSFGEYTPTIEEAIDSTPAKFHSARKIAVGDSGTVYVSDLGYAGEPGGQQYRVMVFKPQSPGDYEHYVYTGQQNDIARSRGRYANTASLKIDFSGNLYLAGDEEINEFAPGEPLSPICEFKLPSGGIQGIAVDPASGEVFYPGARPADGKGHQLTCNSEGKFVEVGSFAITPRPTVAFEVKAFAFNPSISWEEGRPAGVLYAANNAGLGYVFAKAKEVLPAVESESSSQVGTTTATLGALINPKGSQTSYVFQYLSDAVYEANEPTERFAGASEAPLGGAVLGSGQEALSVAAPLFGLAPDTAYRYRVIATSHCSAEDPAKVCEAIGAAQVFRTFPLEAPGLIDSRAYELVSPTDKHGGEVFPAEQEVGSCLECKPGGASTTKFPMQSSPDGEAVVYEGFPFSSNSGAVNENQYLSHRNAKTGWETTILSPALQGNGEAQGYTAFDDDLTQGLLYQRAAPLSPDAPSGFANIYRQAASDPSTLIPALEAEPPNRLSGTLKLTYVGASADLSHVFFEANDALTGETPFAPEAVDGGEGKNNLYEWAEGLLRLVNVLPGNTETFSGSALGARARGVATNAISDDGSRAFWSSESGQVYVRENAEVTREIPDHIGKFLTASADGSKLLLNDGNLFDLEGESSTDLTKGKGGFQGIAGQSDDLSRVYFVDTGVLDETPNDQGATAEAGKDNLYLWHEGESRFIASLVPADGGEGASGRGTWAFYPGWRTAESSPNGQWLAFLSHGQLTGYDNTGPCAGNRALDIVEQGRCTGVFLYSAQSNTLGCASCNPSEERPIGPSRLRLIEGLPGYLTQPRYLTDSGRLYFDSQDSLSPFDTNGNGVPPGHAVEDVYQYEPEGVGSCKRAEGCINLISSGREPVDSNLLTIDESGKNVFFTSRDQLSLKDKDGLVDLYDAREGGGIPAESEVGRSECQGEACQAPVSPPNDPTPGSSTFQGAGNVNEPKAAKKHAKKHKKKRHARKKHAHKRAAKSNRGGAK